MKLAYLLSEYPLLEHTYLLQEVRQLRALGWAVQTVSIRKPSPRVSGFSPSEAEELASTWCILGSSPVAFLQAHMVTLVTRPLRYIKGLAKAWAIGHFDPRATALATAYFTEAVVAGHRLRKADIRHVHSVYTTTVALLLSTIFDIDLSMTFHGPVEFENPVRFRIGEKVKAARFVCTISHFAKSQLMRWSAPEDWQKLEVTPLGIDLTAWPVAPFRERPTPFELISVGRLAHIKGFPLLLEAIASLVRKGMDIRLRLVGDGPERSELEAQARELGIADRVIFEGWKKQDELTELYKASDLFVMSSFAEGVPVVLMEAMACGLPCVAPRITGIPELVRDGIDGLLVTASDTEGLASAIAELLMKPELRRRMANISRERVADKYHLAKNVKHLSEVFQRRLRQSDASPQRAQAGTHKSS